MSKNDLIGLPELEPDKNIRLLVVLGIRFQLHLITSVSFATPQSWLNLQHQLLPPVQRETYGPTFHMSGFGDKEVYLR